MNKLDLPVGHSSFRIIRDRNFYYVDKTAHIFKLARKPAYYFLSRPRRFGKTLLVSTLKELFEGNEKLFRGLHIHDRWDWTVSNPVVRLSFDSKYSEPGDLQNNLENQLAWLENSAGIEQPDITGPDRFTNLILSLHRKTGQQVVILVDEYDKPILDVLDNKELAEANRQYLHSVYGVIKGCADEVRFVFVTGISMYSKVSLFSGLNILEDISLDPRYATICGYTDSDIDTVFAPELEGLDRDEIRRWYNGYSWLGEEKVYNPFDVLLLFSKRQFEPYWYETGTPKYLYKMMAKGLIRTLNLENLKMEKSELSNFRVEEISTNALLFQCGYLTITGQQVRSEQALYTLYYPNQEVRLSLNKELLMALGSDGSETMIQGESLAQLLAKNDFVGFEKQLRSLFSGIPYQWHIRNVLARHEGFYASVLYACFTANGIDIRAEESTSRGRSDLVVLHAGQVFVLELKVVLGLTARAATSQAMRQMRERGYAEKYEGSGKAVHLLALAFNGLRRNLAAVSVETA